MHLHKSTWLMGLFSVCGGCGRSAYRLPNFDAATPTATYSIGGGGSIDCDQAVDADGRWLAWTGAAPGDSSANLLLTLTPLGTAPSADNPSVVIRAGLLEAGTLLTLELTSPGLYFSPDSTLIALSYPAQVVQVGSALQVFDLPGTDVCYAGAMAFTDDGKQLAAACTKDSLRVWDTTDLTAAPTETQLPAGTLSNDPTTAALSSLGGGTWLLAVADDAPQVLKISAAGVTTVDITAANLPVKAGRCRLAFNPSQPAQLLSKGP